MSDALHVHGALTDENGRELSHAEVRLWRRRLRERELLGQADATEEGTYEIVAEWPEAGPGKVLVTVEATSKRLKEPLESSPVEAKARLKVDLQQPPSDPSEYGVLRHAIELQLGHLPITEIVETDEHKDISFLSQEIGRSREEIVRILIAARLSANYDISAAAFYAFLRLHVPVALPTPLLDATDGFQLIDPLVQRIASLIFTLSPDTQTQTLQSAVAKNLIEPQVEISIPSIVEALQTHRSTDLLQQPYLAGKTTLGELLQLAGLPDEKHDTFARALTQNTQSMRNFWRTLATGQEGLTAEEASSVQRTLELGAFVKNHSPLVQALQGRFQQGQFSTLADLARLSVEDWTQLVEQSGPPANIDGAGNATPAEVFARVVYTRVTRAYPTAALAARIATANLVPEPDQPSVTRFFANSPSLDLVKVTVSSYIDANAEKALAGIPAQEQPAVIDNVKRLQRVLRITRDVDAAQMLVSGGLHSATQIAAIGSQQFFNQAVAAGLTKVEANRVFQTAVHRYATSVSMLLQLNRDFIGVWPNAIGTLAALDDPTQEAIQRDQSLSTLFGTQDFCATDECTSVLSPAAYLCDLLLWLRNHPLTGAFATALDALFARRADIGHLLLNCPNTEVPLPYIDLVNELLEDAVSPPMAPVWKQTTQSAAELRAGPEYVNGAAYDVLKAASYPHTLPYDKPLDELRSYLAQSGVTLWQLRQSLLALHSPSQASEISVAAERFAIDPHGQDLITTPNFVPAATAWNTPAPSTDLVSVEAFLQAASITYEQLLELLEVVWVRDGGAALNLQGLSDTCDLSIQSLAPAPLDAGVLDRAHRFLRMWRHAPWQMWELDVLLSSPAVAAGSLDGPGLLSLFTFRRLTEVTGLAVDQQLAFYADLDTTADGHRAPDGTRTPSLFSRLFLDPAVPSDPDLSALASGGPITHPNLSDHLPAIQSALQLSDADATVLFAAPITNGQLTLANLSHVYRVISLARAAGSSLTELLRILPLTSAGTLAAALADPAATLAFIDEVKQTRQSGFSADALVYVLTTSPTTVGITDEQITDVVLPAIRAAIQQTHDEIFTSADPPLTILQRELAQVSPFSDPSLLATAISIVDDTFTGNLAARNAFIAANFSSFVDPATAEAELGPLPGGLTHAQRQAAIAQRANELLAPLATYLTQTRVIAAVAPALGLQADVTALLVGRLQVPATTHSLLSVLTSPHLIDKPGGTYTPLTRANFPEQFTAIDLLDKVGTVIKALHLVKTDLTWLLDHHADYGGIDLTQLPVTLVQPPQPLASLLSTSLIVKLERALGTAPAGATPSDLYGVIAAIAAGTVASEGAAQAALAAIAGWQPADIAALAAAAGAVFPADYTKPATYDALRTLEAMLSAAGASGTQLVAWGASDPDDGAATSARGALEAKYSHADWLALAPKVLDPIRERRSAALQAYLIAERDGSGQLIYGDTDALFDSFLIDVQMSSCEVTTRVIQAYAAVQLFVERCLMGLEEGHGVVVDLARDDTWKQWQWMKRYRIWEANREVFLYPENWLIESQRPNRTEIFEKLEQEIRQSESTVDNLESVTENYIQRLDELAHLFVTGTCKDARTGDVHVIARTVADPPRYYHRVFHDRAWSGWEQIQLDIKAHHAVPALYRGRLCLFWLDVVVSNEPHQDLPAPQASTSAPSQEVARYISIGLNFSIRHSSGWAPVQRAKGHLFDIPLMSSETVSHARAVESLYTLKVQTPAPAPGSGASLLIDVFRLGGYTPIDFFFFWIPIMDRPFSGVHIGRATFDARFSDLELRNLPVIVGSSEAGLLDHARSAYGPDADPLITLPDSQADPDLQGEPNLVPKGGSLATIGSNAASLPLTFTSLGALEQGVGELLHTASVPFRVVGEDSDLAFDPSSYFFYQDNRRCYFVEGARYYQWGSAWLPVAPSDPASAPFEVRYAFHRFYHPYTRLLWHQLAGGGFDALYDRNLQTSPDTIDPTGADVFSFSATYQPVSPFVAWGENNEIIDFARDAAYSVYNWELFYHAPLFVAERLSQNQQFEDALTWFHYIFDPTRQGPEPVPQRFWIPKPLNSLTSPQILSEQINNLLLLVNQGDPNAVAEVTSWRRNPFNPFLLADQRPVAYMKRAVMSYLDNLISWADNLFSTDSREALNEATLLYVLAAEILGPSPQAVVPPPHADASYDDLEPHLDAFANAMVNIENYVPAGGGGGGGNGGPPLPQPQTFYFKVPPNEQLLGYWGTVADRLFKLRHCQNIAGVTRELPLFDAPIDPGLLVAAQAAGVDLGSVLSDLQTARPGYRFTTFYAQALDFCNAVTSYGAALLAALQQKDAAGLAQLLAGQQQQIETENGLILQAQIDAATQDLAALQQALALAQAQHDFNYDRKWANEYEYLALSMKAALGAANLAYGIGYLLSAGLSMIPEFGLGVAGFGGSPSAGATEGGVQISEAAAKASNAGKAFATGLDKGSDASMMAGGFTERKEQNREKGTEAGIQIQQVQAQIAASQIRHDLAVQQLANHQNQLDRLQHQIDYITDMFTSEDLYDWMVGKLSDTYFQSYRLAYKLCQQAERCYRYELGLTASSFVQFGYWDSLKKGLQAGESLVHDLRRMQASYLEQNARRFEISRYVSLAALDPQALLTLIEHGACDFDLPESLFDSDYPGHYQRRLQRVSVTVVYPSPGRFDNVKCTVTMKHNSVRTTSDLGTAYRRQGPADSRFVDEFGFVPQKIALGNAQDDPGLFLTAINDNLGDPRYLPFEGAGAISSWHLELPAATNEIDLGTVADVVLHIHYTALDGGDTFQQAVQADNVANAPTSAAIAISANNDFPAAWQAFLAAAAGGADQVLTLNVSASKFPNWARGKTITISGLTALATSQRPGNFVLRPEAPLPTSDITMTPVAGVTEPNVVSGAVAPPPGSPGSWSFKLRAASAADFRSLTADDIGDVLLLIAFSAA
jgi:Tc toxin complex TcA C-terminal TcB-binding domain/ABC toxin N-terminal region/Neuraminidase-like domain/Salmonella virulence plasmid 28.1kDa A protein